MFILTHIYDNLIFKPENNIVRRVSNTDVALLRCNVAYLMECI